MFSRKRRGKKKKKFMFFPTLKNDRNNMALGNEQVREKIEENPSLSLFPTRRGTGRVWDDLDSF